MILIGACDEIILFLGILALIGCSDLTAKSTVSRA